jgi:excinuclease ABC subunit B
LRVILQSDDPNLFNEAPADVAHLIKELRKEMADASSKMEYERAALLRDQITELETKGKITSSSQKNSYKKSFKKRKGH